MIKNITFIIVGVFISITLHSQCKEQLLPKANVKLDDYTFVKDIPVKLNEVKESKNKDMITIPVMLNKNTKYRFVIEDSKDYEGRLIFELFGEKGRKVSSYIPDIKKHFPVLEFTCSQTGMYFMNFQFEDSKEGCGILVYGFKNLPN